MDMSTSEMAGGLFPQGSDPTQAGATAPAYRTGILPYQALKAMLRAHEIVGSRDILAEQVQPASIDLRLGPVAYRVRASFLPGPNATVMEKIQQLDGYEIDISAGAVLRKAASMSCR